MERFMLLTALCIVASLALQYWAAAVFDIRRIKQEQGRKQQPGARRYRQRPTVSVIVPATDAEQILETLESVRQSSYRNWQLIVAGDSSQKDTLVLAKQFQQKYPKQHITVFMRKHDSSLDVLVKETIRRHAEGELILALPPAHRLRPDSLRKIVDQFNDDPSLEVIQPEVRPANASTIAGLSRTYLHIIMRRWRKLQSLWATSTTTFTVNTTYRRKTAQRLLGARPMRQTPRATRSSAAVITSHRNQTTDDVLAAALRPSVGLRGSWLWRLSVLTSVIAVAGFAVIVGYAVYIALSNNQASLLILCWTVATIVMVSAILDDQASNIKQKAGYIIGMPVTYLIFYLALWCRALGATVKGISLLFHRRMA